MTTALIFHLAFGSQQAGFGTHYAAAGPRINSLAVILPPINNAPAMATDLQSVIRFREGPPAADLPLFRFGLRQMLAFVAAACLLLGGMVILQGLNAMVLLLLTLIVAAHITGTALGSRLRDAADHKAQSLS